MVGSVVAMSACMAPGGFHRSYGAVWEEEVKLNDGRVIIVQQEKKRPVRENASDEAWVTFNLPEFGAGPIVWHETLLPIILNVDSGNLYMVGTTLTGGDSYLYDCPKPFYVAYIWIKGGGWQRIHFEQIPKSIYDANMVLADSDGKNVPDKVTLELKNSEKFNGDFALPKWYKRVDIHAFDSCKGSTLPANKEWRVSDL